MQGEAFARVLLGVCAAMVSSLVIVPVISLFTKSVPFEVKPPTPEGAIDREVAHRIEEHQALRVVNPAEAQADEVIKAAQPDADAANVANAV